MERLWDHHPFLVLGILALTLLVAINIWGYVTRRISLRTVHRRPQEYLPYAALVVEIVHLWRGC